MTENTQNQVLVDTSEPSDGRDFGKWLPKLLRWLGSAALVSAIAAFLFQRWESGGELTRYLLLLGLTIGISVTGFASGRWIGDGKGARLLVSIALVAVPANFAVLGGFIYGLWAWEVLAPSYPGVALWELGDPVTVWITASAAVVVLALVVWLGFLVLARPSANRLSGLYMLSCLALLVPTRDNQVIAGLIVGLAALIAWQASRARQRDHLLPTAETFFARAIQFLPLGVLLGRTIWLYEVDATLELMASLVLFIALRQLSLGLSQGTLRLVVEVGTGLLALSTGFLAGEWVQGVPGVHEAFAVPTLVLVGAGLLNLVGRHASTGPRLYRDAAALTGTLALLGELLLVGSPVTAVASMMAGGLFAAQGYRVRQSIPLVAGVLTAVIGLVHQAKVLFIQFDLVSWSSLAAIGLLAVIASSLLERHGKRMGNRLLSLGRELRSWDY